MKDHAVIYHRYNLSGEKVVWKDQNSPILASIATLRAVNPSVKIYVIDTLDDNEPMEDWGDFAPLLNVHPVRFPRQLPVKCDVGAKSLSYMTSRIWDIWAFSLMIPEPYIVYSDSDILWLRDPFPLSHTPLQQFYGDKRGSGFFYYLKHSLLTETFINTWRSLILGGLQSQEIRTKMRIGGNSMSVFCDEVPYVYMMHNKITQGWASVNPLEHYYPHLDNEVMDPRAKSFHCHGAFFGKNRLPMIRRVKEFNEAIRSVLDQPHADLILDNVKPDIDFIDLHKHIVRCKLDPRWE
jgi:hypothetical protein